MHMTRLVSANEWKVKYGCGCKGLMLVWVLTSDMNMYVKMAVRVWDRMRGGWRERMMLMDGWMGQGPSDCCRHR